MTGEPRSEEKTYNDMNMESYIQEHFGMFQGERYHVTIRALNMLLDTFVDRFGKQGIVYAKDGDKYFTNGKFDRSKLS